MRARRASHRARGSGAVVTGVVGHDHARAGRGVVLPGDAVLVVPLARSVREDELDRPAVRILDCVRDVPAARRGHLDARGRGPSAAVGETPVQICRVRAELRARVIDRGRGVRGRIRVRRRVWIRGGRSADVDEDAHLAALHRAGDDLLVGDGDGAAVDLIGVGAVVECGVEAGKVLVAVHVDHDHAVVRVAAIGLVPFDHQAVLGLAIAQILGVAFHRVAELVDPLDFRALPLVVAGVAEL